MPGECKGMSGIFVKIREDSDEIMISKKGF